jgi:hypothetical protein
LVSSPTATAIGPVKSSSNNPVDSMIHFMHAGDYHSSARATIIVGGAGH